VKLFRFKAQKTLYGLFGAHFGVNFGYSPDLMIFAQLWLNSFWFQRDPCAIQVAHGNV
jgi:hypothetical protein